MAGVDGATIRESDGDATGGQMYVDKQCIARKEVAGATGGDNVGRGKGGGTHGCSRYNIWGL